MADELKPMMGREMMRESDAEQPRGATVDTSASDDHGYSLRPSVSLAREMSAIDKHPITEGQAAAVFRKYVGLRYFLIEATQIREDWWDRLLAAQTAEERLTCKRMIDALNYAHGMSRHGIGAKLAAENIDRLRAAFEAIDEEEKAAKEAAELRRWRIR